MNKGKRFRAICGDGVTRSAVITASEAWAWDAIRAAVQVTVNGERLTVSGNLSAVGLNDGFFYRHAAPPGVTHRFHSSDLTAVCGCTPHRPIAPDLRKAAARLLGKFTDLPGALAWQFLAEDLRAEAAARGLVKPEAHPMPLAWREGSGRIRASALRIAARRISDDRIARFARLAWAFRAWKLAEAETAQGRTEGRAWSDHRI
jgi:hypothetical protein